MRTITLTFWQTFKVFWSFLWRAWVVMIPFWIVIGIVIIKLMPPKPASGEPPQNPFAQPGMRGIFALVYFVMLFGTFALQVVALRWTLKTRWSDFHLLAVASNAQDNGEPRYSK